MKTIAIRNRWTGAVMFSVEATGIRAAIIKLVNDSANLSSADLSSANLSSANLRGANLSSANLSSANLSGANLSSANLRGADLSSANLSSANLSGANLRGANLSGAHGIDRWLSTPLMFMHDQPGKIRAYKLVNADCASPIHHKRIRYEIGGVAEALDADTDPTHECGAGISLATFDWIMREYRPGHRVFIAEFEAKDIACIPIGTDGKFRVFRCTIVAEKDLTEILKAMRPEATK